MIIMKALNLGALGFIPKSAERTVMLGALNLLLAGGTYIPSDVLDRQDRHSLLGGGWPPRPARRTHSHVPSRGMG